MAKRNDGGTAFDTVRGLAKTPGHIGPLMVGLGVAGWLVTLHLVGGVGLLVLLAAQAERYRQAAGFAPEPLSAGLRTLLWLAAIAVAVQIALGGWVSTNYAVLACTTFPSCQGSWWPAMNFGEALQIWRPLGCSKMAATLALKR